MTKPYSNLRRELLQRQEEEYRKITMFFSFGLAVLVTIQVLVNYFFQHEDGVNYWIAWIVGGALCITIPWGVYWVRKSILHHWRV